MPPVRHNNGLLLSDGAKEYLDDRAFYSYVGGIYRYAPIVSD